MEKQEQFPSPDDITFITAIVLSSDDAIEGLTLDGKIIIWNKGSEKLYGYSADEMIGKSVIKVYPKEVEAELPSILSQVKNDEHVKPHITQRKRKDGTLIKVAISASSIKNNKGNIIGVSIISRPFAGQELITTYEKKHIEDVELLKKNEKLFRSLAENIKEVFWQMSPELDKMLYISPAYEEIWGQSIELLYSNPSLWMESVVEEDKEKIELYMAKLKNSESAFTDYRIVRPDGKIKDIFIRGFQVKDEIGKLMSIMGIAADMTEFSQLKSQAHLNDKLTAIGVLTAGIVHEINNPLTWLLGNLEYIKKNATSINHGKLEELLIESIQGVKRIRDIVHNLKGFTRADENEKTTIDVNKILDSALTFVSSDVKLRAKVEKKYALNLPLITLNSGKLHQVFLNLIINALQAMTLDDIKNNKIQIKTSQVDKQLRIDIKDTGIGIPGENLSKIFTPFFTTKPAGIGTGLGLSICSEIVNSFGGKITVESLPGKGTTFSVYLPLGDNIKTESVEKKPEEILNPITARKRILLVDDEQNILNSLKRSLDDYHDVTIALSGQRAIHLLKENVEQYDMVITDLSMAGITGADLYYFVSDNYPALKERIIFMTGGAFSTDLKKFVSSINNPFIYKPFELNELLKLIEYIGA